MKCSDVGDSLFRYSEGCAGRWQAVRLRFHISRCHDCRQSLQSLSESRDKLTSALKESMAAPDVASAIMASLPGPVPISVRKVHWKPVFAAALVMATLLVALFSLRPPSQIQPGANMQAQRKTTPHKQSGANMAALPERSTVTSNEGGENRPESRPRPPIRAHKRFRHGKATHPAEAQPQPKENPPADLPKPETIVVVLQPQERRPAVIEVEATNTETGAITYYSSREGEDGAVQIASMTYVPQNVQ